MNNLPKFRAWHKELKIMANVRDICNLGRQSSIPWVIVYREGERIKEAKNKWYQHEFELMQWTGLQDSKGKDLFIGDIVQVRERHEETISAILSIKANDDWLGWEYDLIKAGEDWEEWFDEEISTDDIEIIGNIYENSEVSNDPKI